MKRFIKHMLLVFAVFVCFCGLIVPRSNTKDAKVVISSDYSTISCDGITYVPIQEDQLPFPASSIICTNASEMIKGTVENENYFLDKFLLTNYVKVKEYAGDKFIYLHTDYDFNESSYYCSLSYKN